MDTSKRRSTDAPLFQAGFEAGLAEGRKQALEEAAKVALEVDWGGKTYDAIRALGDKP